MEEEEEERREGGGEEAVMRRIEALIRKAMGEGGQQGGREGGREGEGGIGGGNGVDTHEQQQQQQQVEEEEVEEEEEEEDDEKERRQAGTTTSPSSLPHLPPSLPLHGIPLSYLGLDSLTLAQLKARIETEFCPPSLAPPPPPPPPPPPAPSPLPRLVPAAAEEGMEGEGGREGWLPDEYFFREETTGGHIAAMVWAVREGGREGGKEGGREGEGGMRPEEAWEVYENWCRWEKEEGREGGGRGVMEVEMVMRARRREGGRRRWKEWVLQISPCCLLLPWCR